MHGISKNKTNHYLAKILKNHLKGYFFEKVRPIWKLFRQHEKIWWNIIESVKKKSFPQRLLLVFFFFFFVKMTALTSSRWILVINFLETYTTGFRFHSLAKRFRGIFRLGWCGSNRRTTRHQWMRQHSYYSICHYLCLWCWTPCYYVVKLTNLLPSLNMNPLQVDTWPAHHQSWTCHI